MEKIYTYKNAIVTITRPNDKQSERIKKATERFARNILKEQITNGNVDQARIIRKK